MISTIDAAEARSGLRVVIRTASALAAAMGVGRFVFTPILPLMEAQAGLSPQDASLLATSNYLGYLIGAVLGIILPWLGRSRLALRASGVVLILTLIAMPMTESVAIWIALRGIAGIASALMFLVAGNEILSELTSTRPHLVGWAYGGVGAGIALSGVLVAVIQQISDWREGWWASALLAAVLLAIGWSVGEKGRVRVDRTPATQRRTRHGFWFGLLSLSYVLEGAGYIIAGTFLVAAVSETGPSWLGGSVWTIVGIAAVPSCALLTWLSTKISRPTLLTYALVLQAVGVALPALSDAPIVAVIAAAIFGGTFVGITTLSLATGRHLGITSAVAILTTGYSLGQVVGPLVVAPTLSDGYRTALLIGAAILLAAGLATALMRFRFPHGDQPHRGTRKQARIEKASSWTSS